MIWSEQHGVLGVGGLQKDWNKFSVFLFCLTFSVFMKLGELVLYPGLEGCPCVGASLDSLRVPSGFGGRARSDMSTSHIFP